MSDPYSPEDAALNNASIVGARLASCVLHTMEVITACIGMVLPFTCAMWTKHKFSAHAQAFFKHEDQLSCIRAKRGPVRSEEEEKVQS